MSGGTQERDHSRDVQLLRAVVAIARVVVHPSRGQQPVLGVQPQRLRRQPGRLGELADRQQVLHDATHNGLGPKGKVKARSLPE